MNFKNYKNVLLILISFTCIFFFNKCAMSQITHLVCLKYLKKPYFSKKTY